MTSLPTPYAAERLAAFLDDHLSWSAWWDKRYGLTCRKVADVGEARRSSGSVATRGQLAGSGPRSGCLQTLARPIATSARRLFHDHLDAASSMMLHADDSHLIGMNADGRPGDDGRYQGARAAPLS